MALTCEETRPEISVLLVSTKLFCRNPDRKRCLGACGNKTPPIVEKPQNGIAEFAALNAPTNTPYPFGMDSRTAPDDPHASPDATGYP